MFDSKAGTPLEGFAEFAAAAAAEGAVLLRNDRQMLPLDPEQPVRYLAVRRLTTIAAVPVPAGRLTW
jgi:beta-glucosidase-like glycosyl hydrolase